jgi:pyrimidine-nucleoside phosphorylase
MNYIYFDWRMHMKMYDVIYKKREGEKLTKSEIEYFVYEYTKGAIPDYQASAFLMACFLNKLDEEETKDLTLAMVNSGDTVDLSSINGIKVDKHSTGGVADTTTLVVAPLVAACGLNLAKMSGRGLGHTGGTLDKLEAIPNFDTSLTMDEFINQVNDLGVAVMGQTMKLVPADKKLYSLRDVTATVDSIPLIASSIMSKKIASGADIIVLDVKVGSGAFMKTLDQANKLAKAMVSIGTLVGRKTVALVTDMNQPLGCAVGNAMEVMEAIEILKGDRQGDLKTVSLELAMNLLILAGKATDRAQAESMLNKAIEDKSGVLKLKQMIHAQNGDDRVIDNFELFEKPKYSFAFKAKKRGHITQIDAQMIGSASCTLGAGREKKEDVIDYSVGIWVEKRLCDFVDVDDTLFMIYYNDKSKLDSALKQLEKAVMISDKPIDKPELVYSIIS